MDPSLLAQEAVPVEEKGDTYQSVSLLEAQSRPSTASSRSALCKTSPSPIITNSSESRSESPASNDGDKRQNKLKYWISLVRRLRSFKWWLLGAAALSAPLVFLSTRYRTLRIGGVPASDLIWYIQVVWLSFWFARGLVKVVDVLWRYIVTEFGLGTTDLVMYDEVVKETEGSVVAFLTALLSWRFR